MAMISIRYGGTVIGSIPIGINRHGHLVTATIKGADDAGAQTGHIWRLSNDNIGAGGGSSAEDSTADQLLEIIITPDDADEFQDGDYLVLETLKLEYLSL
jgi:hypothetical protein